MQRFSNLPKVLDELAEEPNKAQEPPDFLSASGYRPLRDSLHLGRIGRDTILRDYMAKVFYALLKELTLGGA